MASSRNLIKPGRRVYLCGNGGSAANAIHIANDLVSVGIRAHALTADIATLTAIANDYGYEHVFSRQLEVFGEKGDLLMALSGSGKSPNVRAALHTANSLGTETWAIFGAFNEPDMACIDTITMAGETMQEAEQAQLALGHELMLGLCKK